jgi:hypothetical protein
MRVGLWHLLLGRAHKLKVFKMTPAGSQAGEKTFNNVYTPS